MKDIYFSKTITSGEESEITLKFSKKLLKKEKFFLKLLFFKIISNPNSLDKIELELNDMIQTLNIDSFEEFSSFINNFMEKCIYFTISNSKNIYSGTFSFISSYIQSNNFCQIFFTDELKYCFSNKSGIFSSFEIEKFIFMEDSFSFNLYNNVIKNLKEDDNEVIIPITILKSYLNTIDKYERFFDFEKFILKKAIFDINTFSNFYVKYTKIKSGQKSSNKIVSIKLNVKKSNQLPIFYDNNVYKIIETVKDKIHNYEETYNLLLAFASKKGYKYIYDNIEMIKNESPNKFEKKLKKALLLDLSSKKLEPYININQKYKNSNSLLTDFLNHWNKMKLFYPNISSFDDQIGIRNIASIQFLDDGETFEFSNNDIHIYIKYNVKEDSILQISIPKNIIKKMSSK